MRFQDGKSPIEALVGAGLSEIPRQRVDVLEHHLRSQTTVGYAKLL